MKEWIELSHVIENGMPVYPGLPRPKVEPLVDHHASGPRYQHRAEFYLGRIETPTNIGTYLDSPFHRYPDRADLSQVPLERVAGLPGVVLDGDGSTRAFYCAVEARKLAGRAVLVRTGWDRKWGTDDYWAPGPYLSQDFVERCLGAGAVLVGVDFWNADDTEDASRPVHTRLLEAGILIVEHLCGLDQLPESGFKFYAVPLRIVRGASFPVRAFAELG
jgi:kynurenine formamidase